MNMTFDQLALYTNLIVEKNPENSIEFIKKACLEYARSIVGELVLDCGCDDGYDCKQCRMYKERRTQMLSRIEEDSK